MSGDASPQREFDEALRRLSGLTREIEAVGEGDFARLDGLLRQRDAVREHLAQLRPEHDPDLERTTHDLERELAARERQADELRRERIDPVKQSGGGPHSGEMGSLGVVGINSRIREASGLAEAERRISRLRSILEDRQS